MPNENITAFKNIYLSLVIDLICILINVAVMIFSAALPPQSETVTILTRYLSLLADVAQVFACVVIIYYLSAILDSADDFRSARTWYIVNVALSAVGSAAEGVVLFFVRSNSESVVSLILFAVWFLTMLVTLLFTGMLAVRRQLTGSAALLDSYGLPARARKNRAAAGQLLQGTVGLAASVVALLAVETVFDTSPAQIFAAMREGAFAVTLPVVLVVILFVCALGFGVYRLTAQFLTAARMRDVYAVIRELYE